ncbi:MAG: hypothetical protein ABW051_02690 [Burkholderiaceae bacterium]
MKFLLKSLLAALCAEAGIEDAAIVADIVETGSLALDGAEVIVDECDDGVHVSVAVLLGERSGQAAAPELLRYCLRHVFDTRHESLAPRFAIHGPGGDLAAVFRVEGAALETGAAFLAVVEQLIELARDSFADVCIAAAAESFAMPGMTGPTPASAHAPGLAPAGFISHKV